MKIKKGDKIIVIAGKDRTKSGKVLKVDRKNSKVIVEKINLITKHTKPKQENQAGEKIQVPAAIDISNVKLICPKCAKPSRIGKQTINKKNVRICKKCKSQI